MRLLCDQNVSQQYIDAFRLADDFEVGLVREELDARASDADIAAFAAANDWVVVTSDDDFFELADVCGVVYYLQLDAPAVGDVLTAVRSIREAY
jgi:predicted nuclease of predicted toxin-antitoxin system